MGGPRGEAARLTLDDIEAVARELPGIAAWDAQQGTGGGRCGTRQKLDGAHPRADGTLRAGVEPRRFARRGFDAAAVAGSARVALIGETSRASCFGEDDPLDAEILIGSVPLPGHRHARTFRHRRARHGPRQRGGGAAVDRHATPLQRRHDQGAKLLVSDPGAVEETGREVERILRARHALPSGQPNDFR